MTRFRLFCAITILLLGLCVPADVLASQEDSNGTSTPAASDPCAKHNQAPSAAPGVLEGPPEGSATGTECKKPVGAEQQQGQQQDQQKQPPPGRPHRGHHPQGGPDGKQPPPPPPDVPSAADGHPPGPPAPGGHRRMPPYLFELASKPPEEQERILMADPRFRSMPPEQQQRIRDHLKRISAMTPEERQKLHDRYEAFHALSPEARQKIRTEIYPAWRNLPGDRRELMNAEFRSLRAMTPAERDNRYAQPAFVKQFSPPEQQLLKQFVAIATSNTSNK